jgi:hypothetical protein
MKPLWAKTTECPDCGVQPGTPHHPVRCGRITSRP